MLSDLSRNWWLAVLRGSLAIIVGSVAFVWPGVTFSALVLLFGAYALVDGIIMFSYGLLAAGDGQQSWPLILGGIVGIATGILTFAQPQAMALALIYVVGIWAIVTGLLEVVAAVRLRQVISSEWLMGLSGVLSIVFGVLVVAQPDAGALSLVFLFGFYAILAGVSQVWLGIKLHGLNDAVQPRTQTASTASR